jgi:hypothetical protein
MDVGEKQTKEQEDDEVRMVLCSNDVEIMFLLLQILGNVTSYLDSKEIAGMAEVLYEEGVLSSLVGLKKLNQQVDIM